MPSFVQRLAAPWLLALAGWSGLAGARDLTSAAGQLDAYMRMGGSNDGMNPFTNEKDTVLHIANDPVNGRFPAPKAGENGSFPFMRSGDEVFLRIDVLLACPNPLQPAEFPAESSGPMYAASEHFTYLTKASFLAESKAASVPTTYKKQMHKKP